MKQTLPKIAIVQINCLTGNITQNKNKIEEYILKAQKNSIEILVFPKNILLGINAKDLNKDKTLIIACENIKKELKEKYKSIKLIFDDEKIENINIENEGQKNCYGSYDAKIKSYLKKK